MAVAITAAVAAGLYMAWARSMPEDSPLARMYRTEATLTLLAEAVKRYEAVHGAYPPAGPEGLRLAVEGYGSASNYMPDGPPADAWGRPFVYVPHTQYDAADSGALRMDQGYFAPETFQLYSLGADGKAGGNIIEHTVDNIHNWDEMRAWRQHYRRLHRSEVPANGAKP